MFQIFENRKKKEFIWKDCLLSFSGGQDSTNLVILWINLFLCTPSEKNSHGEKPSLIWCNHLWKKRDFYLLRHSFQISFIFQNRFFYTLFFSKFLTEQKARKFRYLSFLRIANFSHFHFVLTAHTETDNIETFFINLFRGSGKFGLQTLRNSQILLNNDCSHKFF